MNIVIIGAGGVTSYLLPVLIKGIKPTKVTLIDQDKLEARNLDRQLFAANQVGQFKADALANLYRGMAKDQGCELTAQQRWFTPEMVLPEDTSMIICCADNHEARHAACLTGAEMGINVYLGGNEYFDNEAHLYNRSLRDVEGRDVLLRFPEITTSTAGSPTSCQGEALEVFPQLAIANFNCAAKILHLVWVWEVYLISEEGRQLTPENVQKLPISIASTLWGTEVL